MALGRARIIHRNAARPVEQNSGDISASSVFLRSSDSDADAIVDQFALHCDLYVRGLLLKVSDRDAAAAAV